MTMMRFEVGLARGLRKRYSSPAGMKTARPFFDFGRFASRLDAGPEPAQT